MIGHAPGGVDDTTTRFITDKLTQELGRPAIVENRDGRSTTIAGHYVANAPANGYALMGLITTGIVQTVLRNKLLFKVSSFAQIVGMGWSRWRSWCRPLPSQKVTSIEEFTVTSRTGDGVTYASWNHGVFECSAATEGL